ncbi:MAG: hypothetical protein ACYC66_14405 [Chloroflexota bacterium]
MNATQRIPVAILVGLVWGGVGTAIAAVLLAALLFPFLLPPLLRLAEMVPAVSSALEPMDLQRTLLAVSRLVGVSVGVSFALQWYRGEGPQPGRSGHPVGVAGVEAASGPAWPAKGGKPLGRRAALKHLALALVGFLVVAALVSAGMTILSGRSLYRATPMDALREWEFGDLRRADLSRVEVLQQAEVAGGLMLLYRWSPPWAEPKTHRLVAAYLTRDWTGWDARASGRIDGISDPPGFVAQIGYLGPVATAYGISDLGRAARVLWGDGQTALVDLHPSGSFLASRDQGVRVERVELLDSEGRVLQMREWPAGG